MLNLVLILNTVAAIWGGRILFRRTRNYCIYLFESVFVLLFAVRPFSVSYFGLLSVDLLRFGIDDRTVLRYAICGLVFIIVLHLTVYRLCGRQRLFSDRLFRTWDFDKVKESRFVIVLLMFAVLTYAVNAFKFHSLTYVFERLDSFAAMMNLAGGLWFVEILSSILIFPVIALLARNLDATIGKLFFLLLIAMSVFTILARPSTRTATIALLVALAIYLFSAGKLRINAVSIGIISVGVIALVVFLNGLRQGDMELAAQGADPYSIFGAAYQNVSSADNGMILIDYLKDHSWVYFSHLLASLSPLSLVPSVVFPFKPRSDIEATLTSSIFGFDLDPTAYHEGSTLTYTVPATGYAEFGFFGVVVAALLYGFIFAVFLRGWKCKSPSVRFIAVYFVILLIGGFRLSIEALAGTFYWMMLAMWGTHFVLHFRFLPPAKVPVRTPADLPS